MARSPVGARLVAAMAAIAALAAPAAAQSPIPHVDVGIGEQNPTLFDDPRFQTTGIRHARLIVPYDVVRAGGAEPDADGRLARGGPARWNECRGCRGTSRDRQDRARSRHPQCCR